MAEPRKKYKETQIDFPGKLHFKHVTGGPHIFIAIDRYFKWPVIRVCRSTAAKEVNKLPESFIDSFGFPEKTKSDKASAFLSEDFKEICENKIIEVEDSAPSLHTITKAFERAKQTLKNLNIASVADKISSTENLRRALRMMQFTVHTGIKFSPFESHPGRQTGTELTKTAKSNKSYLSDWATLNVLVPLKQILIYIGCNEKEELTDHIAMARTSNNPYCST